MSFSLLVHRLSLRLRGVCENPKQEVWWMVERITGQSKAQLLVADSNRCSRLRACSAHSSASDNDSVIPPVQMEVLRDYVRRRQERVPLQYILGDVPFCGFDLNVEQPILIPRPETEQWCCWLIHTVRKSIPVYPDSRPFHVLDLCSGSGNIALALAKHLPNSVVLGTLTMSILHRGVMELMHEHYMTLLISDYFPFLSTASFLI